MTFLTSNLLADGVRIAYRDQGRGEPVLFIHGTPSHAGEWRHIVPRIEADGYRTIAYDLLGYGLSERPAHRDTSVAAQTDLLEAVLDTLSVDTVNLVAHDIGGAIAQRFAIAHPERVRRLMLIDTVSYDSWPSATWRKIIDEELDDCASLSQEAFNTLLTRQLTMTVSDTTLMTGELLHDYLRPHQSPLGRLSFFEHQVRHYDSTYTEEIADELPSLRMPVRILWGERDQWQPVTYAERLRDDIPRADLVVVPDAGHFVMEDAPERVTREIGAFLAEPVPSQEGGDPRRVERGR
ncbi:alpha/beta fold hydrolase [Streptantibioticus cattleyicolor]|uniref:Alpha/beta hydrolase n=1 Tax=Streptantibioticus cattleyicolor (strain ATCC 35852 / DSM 46488 / JCM 4925 / NBRC 14057 / NRRL 8057) TaxID=1003195 RepID=F8JKL2_STREN|nr:alpha/beta hydrolase [Streptantibioticus cattleyicolor]AEW99716.1 alpha/beta hydrolase [Streptantibioticus cattleyicolor NRRL 8057 = DSM 46488]CCB71245.1 Alpha/beta hydrolase [Streptantibioticus cattleyicolor NRRL 8057 = DSM 46488]